MTMMMMMMMMMILTRCRVFGWYFRREPRTKKGAKGHHWATKMMMKLLVVKLAVEDSDSRHHPTKPGMCKNTTPQNSQYRQKHNKDSWRTGSNFTLDGSSAPLVLDL